MKTPCHDRPRVYSGIKNVIHRQMSSTDNKVVYVGDDSDEEENALIYAEPTAETVEHAIESTGDDVAPKAIAQPEPSTDGASNDTSTRGAGDSISATSTSNDTTVDTEPSSHGEPDESTTEEASVVEIVGGDDVNASSAGEDTLGEDTVSEDIVGNLQSDGASVEVKKIISDTTGVEELNESPDTDTSIAQEGGGDKFEDPGDSVSSAGDDDDDDAQNDESDEEQSDEEGSQISLDTEAILNVDPLYYRLTKFLQCGGDVEGEPKQNVAQILFQINSNLVKMNQLFETYLEKK